MTPGTLYGIGVGPGYWRQPERTALSFVPNPHAAETFGETLYRTGDLGLWQHEGTLKFLGRLDHQVKVRGFRIEPAEIEAALTRHPQVREAIVLDHLDQKAERRLVAYLRVRMPAGDGTAPDRVELELRLFAHACHSLRKRARAR